MKTRMIWGNPASTDLDRTAKFYTELGFKPNGKYDSKNKIASFVFDERGFVINFFTEQKLGEEVNGSVSVLKTGNEIIFSLSAESKDEVREWEQKAKAAGAKIFAASQDYEGGYVCGFTDPDGHKFNVFYMEGM